MLHSSYVREQSFDCTWGGLQVVTMHWPAHLHMCGMSFPDSEIKYMESLAAILVASCDRETGIHTVTSRTYPSASKITVAQHT